MAKILSLIIPTYNMAALLPRCLDSILVPEALDALEAIVVNDGSKDNSLEVARGYVERFPDTVTIVDKPNGNYGSTINAALPVAKGKYVKVLDSDDWFDGKALVEFLGCLGKLDVDMAVTHFSIIHDDGTRELSKYNVYGREPYEYGKVYDLDEVLGGGHIRFFLMHGLTYRTELLRQNGYRQTEGVSYTDTEWSSLPLFYARDIVFFDIDLYQYNLAREGQTMDPKVLARSLSQLETVTFNMLGAYENADRAAFSAPRKAFLDQYFRNRIRIMTKCHLMDIPRQMFNPEVFEDVDSRLQTEREKLGLAQIKLYPENKIVRADAYKYWQKHHKRFPAWFESFNKLTNRVVTWAYRLIFRRK